MPCPEAILCTDAPADSSHTTEATPPPPLTTMISKASGLVTAKGRLLRHRMGRGRRNDASRATSQLMAVAAAVRPSTHSRWQRLRHPCEPRSTRKCVKRTPIPPGRPRRPSVGVRRRRGVASSRRWSGNGRCAMPIRDCLSKLKTRSARGRPKAVCRFPSKGASSDTPAKRTITLCHRPKGTVASNEVQEPRGPAQGPHLLAWKPRGVSSGNL